MQSLSITLDFDMAEKFMIAMLHNTGDTAIWCIRQAHKNLASGGGTYNWADIGDNLKILGAVNELLVYHGGRALDLATHETENPV